MEKQKFGKRGDGHDTDGKDEAGNSGGVVRGADLEGGGRGRAVRGGDEGMWCSFDRMGGCVSTSMWVPCSMVVDGNMTAGQPTARTCRCAMQRDAVWSRESRRLQQQMEQFSAEARDVGTSTSARLSCVCNAATVTPGPTPSRI